LHKNLASLLLDQLFHPEMCVLKNKIYKLQLLRAAALVYWFIWLQAPWYRPS